jgi:hypothetical protein
LYLNVFVIVVELRQSMKLPPAVIRSRLCFVITEMRRAGQQKRTGTKEEGREETEGDGKSLCSLSFFLIFFPKLFPLSPSLPVDRELLHFEPMNVRRCLSTLKNV